MLGTSRLLTFLFRALVLLLVISVLWVNVSQQYSEALVTVARPLLPADLTVRVLGAHLIYDHPSLGEPVSIRAYALQYGIVLMAVLVLAAVGIGFLSRAGWLLATALVFFVLHVTGAAVLARGILWAAGHPESETPARLVLALFAVFWGLVPAVFGGAWCLKYWLPRLTKTAPSLSDSAVPLPADRR